MRASRGGVVEQLLSNEVRSLANGLTGSGPIPDGTVLPADPIAANAAGRYNKVPVLAGNTGEEGKLFAPFVTLFGGPPGFSVSDAVRFNMMANFNPNAQPTPTEADILDATPTQTVIRVE